MSDPNTRVQEKFNLSGRVAMITGAGQGVGRGIALAFAAAGADAVIVNDLVTERAESVAAEIDELGSKGVPGVANVASWDEMERAVNAAGRPVSILVNNAGIPPMDARLASRGGGKKFVESGPDDWKIWMDVNVMGAFIATRLCLPGMLEDGWGRVVNIISDASRTGERGMVAYGAAKAAVAGMSRSLAKEVGRKGVTVNSIAIGATVTPTVEEGVSEEILESIRGLYPIGRLGMPDDISPTALLLASQAGSWITGQTLAVNGGYSVTL
jgi:NAD(P)-dependent dehydrogenase (short-subunit alcohol dehydrogenase family)